MIFRKSIIALFIVFLLSSCEKKELPVEKYNRGELITASVNMGSDYRQQVWYSFSRNQITGENLKTSWDLALESSTNGFRVYLNTSKGMRALKSQSHEITSLVDTSGIGLQGKSDHPCGSDDSTAIGDWRNHSNVYVLNLGYDINGQHLGYYKLKIYSENAGNTYRLVYGNAFQNATQTLSLTKNDLYMHQNISLINNSATQVEPPKGNFDICFTQFTHLFYDPHQYYLVTGAISFQSGLRAIKIKNKAFTEISLQDTIGKTFSSYSDAIGYDWKTFNFSDNTFSIDPTLAYLIQDNKGFYYKLRFIDFYNSQGQKGCPKFEFKKL